MRGPGKYDNVATIARKLTNATCVAVIVFDGNGGPGFSVQGDLKYLRDLPRILRSIAEQVEADLEGADEKDISGF